MALATAASVAIAVTPATSTAEPAATRARMAATATEMAATDTAAPTEAAVTEAKDPVDG